MASYNLKTIGKIPPAEELVDIVLSKTNRRTPTEVHPGFKIQRIRSFYLRKIKYCSGEIIERLTKILEDFPNIDDLHPFFADLLNVLYDKDHFKIALGNLRLTKARSTISRTWSKTSPKTIPKCSNTETVCTDARD